MRAKSLETSLLSVALSVLSGCAGIYTDKGKPEALIKPSKAVSTYKSPKTIIKTTPIADVNTYEMYPIKRTFHRADLSIPERKKDVDIDLSTSGAIILKVPDAH